MLFLNILKSGSKLQIMKGTATVDLINKLETISLENIQLVEKKCSHLGMNQLCWKPNAYSWSIIEVLAHLNSLAKYYHPHLSKRIENTKFKEETETFQSSHLGKSAWKMMKLGKANNVKRKFGAPKSQNPTIHPELIEEESVNHFIQGQHELIKILHAASKVNLKKTKANISISKVVKLRLGDVLMFVVYHNERHIQQIKNILAMRQFPKKQKAS